MKGKTAIVTGSTSGIGHGIATSLAAEGCNILLNGFGPPDEIQRIKTELAETYKVKVAYSPADMSKPADIRAMVALAASELGGADILVNNAGIQFTAPVDEFPDEKWDAIIAINLSAAFHASKAAIPHMRKAGWGRIINIASAHGLVASTHKVGYVAAKHGIVGMTKVIALENANDGITCNAICPGWVLTPLVQKQIEDRAKSNNSSIKAEEHALLSEKQPMDKFTTPAELGALTVFLCGENASTMTGTTLSMDGGWVAQ
jgi:3-hydroxybutyrate dehydrogenase